MQAKVFKISKMNRLLIDRDWENLTNGEEKGGFFDYPIG